MRVSRLLLLLALAGLAAFGYHRFLRKLPPPPAGVPAPEIVGVDLDGRPMALSEYRGRVVVLTFWGYWCSTCRAEMPAKKRLAETFAGRPVVFLGVNSDGDREATAKRAVAENLGWRSFWNDGRFSGTPIAWGVRSWPSTFLIDAAGYLRSERVKLPELGARIEELLGEIAPGGGEKR